MKLYSEEEVVKIIEGILQYPDELMDAVQNENTDIGADDLLELGQKNLPGLPSPESKSVEELKEKFLKDFFATIIGDKIKFSATNMKHIKQGAWSWIEQNILPTAQEKEELNKLSIPNYDDHHFENPQQ